MEKKFMKSFQDINKKITKVEEESICQKNNFTTQRRKIIKETDTEKEQTRNSGNERLNESSK